MKEADDHKEFFRIPFNRDAGSRIIREKKRKRKKLVIVSIPTAIIIALVDPYIAILLLILSGVCVFSLSLSIRTAQKYKNSTNVEHE